MSEAAEGRPLLVFLNEVAGGRKLLQAVRERAEKVPYVAVAAPQNQPAVGQLIDAGELRDAARARVEVTMAVLSEFGIESVGEVMDPDPALALDDAVRAHEPGEVLLSCLYETRFGFTRKDLVEWAGSRLRARDDGDPHPGADRGRLDPLGRRSTPWSSPPRPSPRRTSSTG